MPKHPKNDYMVWTWAGWEPLQFYRRLGGFHEAQEGNALWQKQWSDKLHSQRTGKALAQAGVNWVTTHLFKGLGLAVEDAEIQDTARMIRNFHKHGVRVFTYIQYGTIMPETLSEEMPDARRLGRVDWHNQHDGHPYEYGDQYFRAKPCANQPGFREYLLRCVDKAIEIGADGIWIDNLNSDGCYCPCCQKAFREYLQATVKDPWGEMGLTSFDHVDIPRALRRRDPLVQAWIRFRCREVRTSMEMIAARARQLKPDVVVAANVGLGNHITTVTENADWVGDLACLDYTYAENGLLADWRDNTLVSQHLTMKLSAAAGFKVVPGAGAGGHANGPYHIPGGPSTDLLRRVFAESAILGGHAANGPWGLRGETGGSDMVYLRDARLRKDTRELADFYSRRHELFHNSADASPVGVLYNFESIAFDESPSAQVLAATAQALLQNQAPFRYFLSDHLNDLETVKVLILPHVLPLSDAVAARLRAYVRRGGKLLLTGRSGMYDHAFRMRVDNVLADVTGFPFSNDFESAHQHSLLTNPANGCMLIPGEWGLTHGKGGPAICQVSADRIVRAIRQAVGIEALPEVLSPVPHVLFDMRRLANGRRLLGLVNYGTAAVGGISITLPAAGRRTIRTFSTIGGDGKAAIVPAGKGIGRIFVPSLKSDLFLVV